MGEGLGVGSLPVNSSVPRALTHTEQRLSATTRTTDVKVVESPPGQCKAKLPTQLALSTAVGTKAINEKPTGSVICHYCQCHSLH